jgi:hypothetical protein
MRVLSRIKTKVAYDGGAVVGTDLHKATPRVELAPGVNDVSDADAEVLKRDPHFKSHTDNGYMAVLPDEPPPAPAPEPVADPRAKLANESKKAYDARMKSLDEAEFVAAWKAMTDEERAAMAPTMTDEQKALVA